MASANETVGTKSDKSKLWQDIQRRDMKLAEFLKTIQRTFGKPESVTLKDKI